MCQKLRFVSGTQIEQIVRETGKTADRGCLLQLIWL